MTSSKKKHHPPAAAVVASAKHSPTRAVDRPAVQAAARPAVAPSQGTTRTWLIRSAGVLAIAVGLSMALLGVTPDIAGGWGKLVLVAPGMLIATIGFIAIIETTPLRRHKRRGRM